MLKNNNYIMLPEISSLKKKRLLSGLNQKELAKISAVSQSIIAKIESGKINPSYLIVKRIFESLENLDNPEEKKCYELMSKSIFFAKTESKISEVSFLMHKHSISQLPILEGKKIVGLISENTLLEKLNSGIDYSKLKLMKAKEIMEIPLPTVNINFLAKSIIPLIKESGAVLVLDKEKPVGIITKSDLI